MLSIRGSLLESLYSDHHQRCVGIQPFLPALRDFELRVFRAATDIVPSMAGFPVPDTETVHTVGGGNKEAAARCTEQRQRHQVQCACSIGYHSTAASLCACLTAAAALYGDGLPAASFSQQRAARSPVKWIACMLEAAAAHCCSCIADQV